MLQRGANRVEPGVAFGDTGLRFAASVPTVGRTSVNRAVDALLRSSQNAYGDPDLHSFHNYKGHIRPVGEVGDSIMKRCRRYGVSVSDQVMRSAVPSHDTFLALPPAALGASFPEEVSGWTTYWILKNNGAPEKFARAVERTIFGTHVAVPIEEEDVHAKIMRAADLSNIGSEDYSYFWRNTQRLYFEMSNRTGSEAEFKQFVRGALDYLSGYIAPYIRLTPEAVDEQGRSLFHMRAMANLRRLFEEAHNQNGDSPTKVVAELGIGKDAATILQGRAPKEHIFYIGVAEHGSTSSNLKSYRTSKKEQRSGPTFFIPGTSDSAPIPDNSCDTVYVHNRQYGPQNLAEGFRILKEGPASKLYLITEKGEKLRIAPYPGMNAEQIRTWIADE